MSVLTLWYGSFQTFFFFSQKNVWTHTFLNTHHKFKICFHKVMLVWIKKMLLGMNVLCACLQDRSAQMYLDIFFFIFLEALLISKVKVYVCMFEWGWQWMWCSQKLAGILAMPSPLRNSSPPWIMLSANCDKSLRLPNKQYAPENTKDQQSRWHLTVCESVCESVCALTHIKWLHHRYWVHICPWE